MHCISVLGSRYDVIQEDQVKSFWGLTFMKLKKTNFLKFLSKGAYHTIEEFSLYNCHYCLVACAFML
jgi:hypothetical protein